ncbi:hypothetical protein [Actinomyces israelii]|uniref:hypothetical protein n=1 Tax=Actinomyces israelii TaxID=1659 RepID=UPI003982D7F5
MIGVEDLERLTEATEDLAASRRPRRRARAAGARSGAGPRQCGPRARAGAPPRGSETAWGLPALPVQRRAPADDPGVPNHPSPCPIGALSGSSTSPKAFNPARRTTCPSPDPAGRPSASASTRS